MVKKSELFVHGEQKNWIILVETHKPMQANIRKQYKSYLYYTL